MKRAHKDSMSFTVFALYQTWFNQNTICSVYLNTMCCVHQRARLPQLSIDYVYFKPKKHRNDSKKDITFPQDAMFGTTTQRVPSILI